MAHFQGPALTPKLPLRIIFELLATWLVGLDPNVQCTAQATVDYVGLALVQAAELLFELWIAL